MTQFVEPNFPAIFTESFTQLRQFDKNLITTLGGMSNVLQAILDGGISFTDNMDVSFVTYTSNGVANTQDTVAHGLGKVPSGYIPVTKDKAADVYNTSAADATNLYLKCSVASATIKILVF